MKIKKIDVFPLRWTYPNPICDARSKIVSKSALLIKIWDEEGRYGWGEAATFGDIPEIVSCAIKNKLEQLIVGKETEPRRITEYLYKITAHYGQRGLIVSAISGIEIALWDLVGKKEVKIYSSIGYYGEENNLNKDMEILESDLKKINLKDFSGIKIKIGKYGVDNDAERVKLARNMIGDKPILIADANNSLNRRETIQLSENIAKYNVLFIEEPIPFGNEIESKRIRDLAKVSIGGYELDCREEGFNKYIDNSSVDYIQPDVIWSGGIYECMLIAQHAKRNLISLIPHNFSTSIALAANLQLISATDAGELLEYDNTGNPFMTKLEKNALYPKNGVISIKDLGGIGVEPEEELIKEFMVKGE